MESKREELRGKRRSNTLSAEPRMKRLFWGYLLAFLTGGVLTAAIFAIVGNNSKKAEDRSSDIYPLNVPGLLPPSTKISSSPKIRQLHQLLALNPDELKNVDIGLMNLLCAKGLPGAENLNIDEYLAKLDYWADHVRKDTNLRIQNFHQNPAKYDNSENVFKMANLVLALKEDMGIHYNMDNMTRVDFSDSREIFIHGPLSGGNHGSCTNLPVLCVAVARRLGYPVKLVATSEHFFLRWDNPADGERFNIEVSCKGTDTPKDEHYKNWPRQLTELDYHQGYLLKSLAPDEELAAFMSLRGDVLKDAGKIAEAQVAYAHAYRLLPDKTVHLVDLAATVDGEMERLAKKDYLAMGKRINYTVSRSMDSNDLANAWIYRYPKTSNPQVKEGQYQNIGKNDQ
ncbi:MAG: transglutaminase family protein [Sedimentisphaerales bacterium]|jgi:tetratricopeptide (TPR) repeat protein